MPRRTHGRRLPRLLAAVTAVLLAGAGCTTGTSSTAAPGTTSSAVALPPPHRVLLISDSSGWTVAERYAALAQKALGGPVDVDDWATGGLTAAGALARIDAAPDVVAAADIILVYGSPGDTSVELSADGDPCFSGAAAGHVVPDPDWTPYRRALDKVYARILELRRGRPTVIRAFDLYSPVIARWRTEGIEAGCTQRWEGFSGAVHEAARARGITFVSIYDAFNGPSHDRDPVALGYIGSDGQHASPRGAEVSAEALAAPGFDPIVPR